jgi:beta-mannosidase
MPHRGPAFVPAGVWQPAYLVQLRPSDLHVRNSLVDIYRNGQVPLLRPDQSQPWVVKASLDIIGSIAKDATLTYEIFDLKNRIVSSGSLSNITRSANSITGSTHIPAGSVKLWWPVGLGNQTLYTLRVNLTSSTNPAMAASVIKRVGFRTILLNQEPIRPDQTAKGIAPGSNWNFEINGKEFYAKGSNLIPPDTFWTRVTIEKVRQLLYAVRAGNQNMLRVWSSGAYLPDFMYDMADGQSAAGCAPVGRASVC